MDSIFILHEDLKSGCYHHDGYQAFSISDPKPRSIHKASVRDRLLHHAIYRVLYPFFDKTFIADSYSENLKLQLHPDKVFMKTLSSGVDFLGWVSFLDHRVLRTSTKRRMMKRIKESSTSAAVNSYLGLLKNGNTNKIRNSICDEYIKLKI